MDRIENGGRRATGAHAGELVTHVRIPLPPIGTRCGYLKVRDRASYEFALTSAAAALLTPDKAANEVLPVVASAAGSTT